MAKQLFTNNADATIENGISASATTIVLAAGKGALFPSPTGGDYALATLFKNGVVEIIKITARTTDTLTVVRAQEGTTGVIWEANATIQGRATKGTLERFEQNVATGTTSLALGGALAAGNNAVAVGQGSTTVGGYATSVGYQAAASGNDAIAIGASPDALGTGAIAIGNNAQGVLTGSIAIGTTASAAGPASIAIGMDTSITGAGSQSAITIGELSTSSNTQTITMGKSSNTTQANAIAIGTLSTATGTDSSIAIGAYSAASAASAIAQGNTAIASGSNSVAMGSFSAASTSQSIAIGEYAKSSNSAGIVNIGGFAGRAEGSGAIAAWSATTAYTNQSYITISGVLCQCQVAGTSAGTIPSLPSNNGDTFLDGTVLWMKSQSNVNGDSVALGTYAAASEVAIGGSSKGYGVSIGRFSMSNRYSVAMGNSAKAGAGTSIALGRRAQTFDISYSLDITGLPSMHKAYGWNVGSEYTANTGLSGILASEPLDLTGGADWTATTAVKHGHVRKPTTPNGCQYIFGDNDYDIWSDPKLLTYTASSTGATEPTWPTTFGSSVSDGNGDWVCIPNSGTYVMELPCDMLIEEVLFVCYEATAVTVQATISIGTTGNLTKIVNAQPTVGLTANKTVTKWTPAEPVLVPDITIKIDTLATGTQLLGRFMFKGFYTKAWV
jgi:hypothetical protein